MHALTWCSLVVIALTSLLPAAGVTVCLGGDGHFALGATGEACPCDSDDPAQLVDSGSRLVNEQHPPCNDMQIDAPTLVQDLGHTQVSVPAPCESGAAWLPQATQPPRAAATPNGVLRAQFYPPQSLQVKQVTVLLI